MIGHFDGALRRRVSFQESVRVRLMDSSEPVAAVGEEDAADTSGFDSDVWEADASGDGDSLGTAMSPADTGSRRRPPTPYAGRGRGRGGRLNRDRM